MLKFFGTIALTIIIAMAFNGQQVSIASLLASILAAVVICYVLPFIAGKMKSSANEKRWQQQAQLERVNRENDEERRHQEDLRREREKLEMYSEVRIRELISTLEVQHVMDAKKMERLTSMKAEFASRQKSDMADLLGRLEAMKAA